jgi:hypothetical protein
MQNNEKLLTPVAKALFPHVINMDTRYKEEYNLQLEIEDTPEWNLLLKRLTAGYDEYHKAQCIIGGKDLKRAYVPWVVNKQGQRVFRLKVNATGTKDGKTWSNKPKVYAPDGKTELTDADFGGQALGNGSRMLAGFESNFWTTDGLGVGLTARLKFVQVIKPEFYSPSAGFKSADPNKPAGLQAVIGEDTDWFQPLPKRQGPTPNPEGLPDESEAEIDDILEDFNSEN